MVNRIKVNMEEIESMLYFWHATADKERVSETYLNEIAALPGLACSYDNEFSAESVRKVLSAITNRELLSQKTQKEGRFWNNNMWMMEDLSYTDSMVKPLKILNLESLVEELKDCKCSKEYEEIEIIFSPLHVIDYMIAGNRLIINFFRIRPSFENEEEAFIDDKNIKVFIKEKLLELLNK